MHLDMKNLKKKKREKEKKVDKLIESQRGALTLLSECPEQEILLC